MVVWARRIAFGLSLAPVLMLGGCPPQPLPPAAVIRYSQFGACNGTETPSGLVSAGPNAAYVMFAIERIDNTATGTPFAFDPTRLFIPRQPGQSGHIDPGLNAAQFVLGGLQTQPLTLTAGQLVKFTPEAYGMAIAATQNPNGAAEADRTSYFLDYQTGPNDPPVTLVKLDGARTVWPSTLDCAAINLQTRSFLYVAHREAYHDFSNYFVAGFAIDEATGALSSIGSSLLSAPASYDLAIDPSARFLYVSSLGSDGASVAVSGYAIDSAIGLLIPVGSTPVQLAGVGGVVDPSGSSLYDVATTTVAALQGSVAGFTLDPASGAPTEVLSVPIGMDPFGPAIDPTGQFVYALGSSQGNVYGSQGEIYGFRALGSGFFFVLPPVPTVDAGPISAAADPSGHYLYVANADSASVSAYAIDPGSGNLTALGPAVPTGNYYPVSMAVEPAGGFLYVAAAAIDEQSPGVVLAFAISAGTLTADGPPVATGTWPVRIAVDRLGRFVYVINTFDSTISGFAINPSSGQLSPLATLPVGLQPQGLAISGTLQ